MDDHNSKYATSDLDSLENRVNQLESDLATSVQTVGTLTEVVNDLGMAVTGLIGIVEKAAVEAGLTATVEVPKIQVPR